MYDVYTKTRQIILGTAPFNPLKIKKKINLLTFSVALLVLPTNSVEISSRPVQTSTGIDMLPAPYASLPFEFSLRH